jgi:8-oxo-dGTP diphosphatase
MPQDKRVGVGTALILIRASLEKGDRQILLLKRQGSHNAGMWGLPGGWMDYEDFQIPLAVLREVEEEIGLVRITYPQFYTVTTELQPELGIRSVTLFYRSDFLSGVEPQIMEPHKCSDMGWFSRGELPQPLVPGLDAVIQSSLRG